MASASFRDSMICNKCVGNDFAAEHILYLLTVNGWQGNGAHAFCPPTLLDLPPVPWVSVFQGVQSIDKAALLEHLSSLQTPWFVRSIEEKTFAVNTFLGCWKSRFVDTRNSYFIWVQFVEDEEEEIRLTSSKFTRNTMYDSKPLHVSLGDATLSWKDIKKLCTLVKFTGELSLQKWSKNPEKSSYLVKGPLKDICDACMDFGFAPRGQWHISL